MQVCCCFFHWNAFRFAVVFYWNLFNIHIQMSSDYTLIWFIKIKWHEHSITCMANHSSLMYKMRKKTFEILRNEIIFLMDL